MTAAETENHAGPGLAAGREGTVRVGPLVNVEPVVSQLGYDPALAFRRAGLQAELFRDPDQRISYRQGGRLLAAAAGLTGCEHFGLLVGMAGTPSHLGVTGFLVRAAGTVHQALGALVGNLDLHDTGGAPSLDIADGYVQLSFSVQQADVAALDHIHDLVAGMMYGIMRALCGKSWNASQVFLPRRRPANTVPYRRLFQSVILFDSDRCAISFPDHWLAQGSPTADLMLYQQLETEARELHERGVHDMLGRLPTVLRHGLLIGACSAADIAAEMGIAERTLHRRLQHAGTSFRRELDETRKTVSHQLLTGTNLPVSGIANAIGYGDSSAFIRAFRRWSGESPASWRRQAMLARRG